MRKPAPAAAPVVRKVTALPPALWERVNEWRHDNRIGTEVEAVRRLIEIGLDAETLRAAR